VALHEITGKVKKKVVLGEMTKFLHFITTEKLQNIRKTQNIFEENLFQSEIYSFKLLKDDETKLD
jgi:hypothetical protein